MNARCCSRLILALLAFAGVAAHAADVPKRKPGLWQIESKSANLPPMMQGPMKQCIDAKTDDFFQQLGQRHKDKCSVMDIKNTSERVVVHSVCKFGDGSATTDAVFTGKLDSDYRGDIRVNYDPPMHGMSESSMTLSAKWLGACEADQQPGDMILPNGMKINPQQMRGAKQ